MNGCCPGSGGETNMADLKSFHSNPVDSGSTRRARMIGGAATAAATAVLALMIVLDFNGCSKGNDKNTKANPTSQSTAAPSASIQPATPLEQKVETVIEKKKELKRASTATYK